MFLYIKARCNKDSIVEIKDSVLQQPLLKMQKKDIMSCMKIYGSKSRKIMIDLGGCRTSSMMVYVNGEKIAKEKLKLL